MKDSCRHLFRLIRQDLTEAKGVISIAWVSFFWSMGSLMVFSVFPAFLKDEIGVSNASIGFMEGAAIGASFALKVFAGVLSDIIGGRRRLIIIGSVFTVLSKPFFALSSNMGSVFLTRVLDRISKGLRSAPTDAYIADHAGADLSLAYGVRQALYTLGAVFGAAAAILIMWLSDNNYRLVFWLSMIPSLIGLGILWFWVFDSAALKPLRKQTAWNLSEIKELPPVYWAVIGIAGCMMIARFSEAFLSLRAKELGWAIHLLPLIVIIMDIVHATLAFFNGRLGRYFSRRALLIAGLCLIVIADLVLVLAATSFGVFWGIVINGLSLGLTQGVLRAMIASTAPAQIYGTAFAIFYLVSGIGVLCGNAGAGLLADSYGLYSTFLAGMVVSSCALYAVFFLPRSSEDHKRKASVDE